MQCCAVFFVLGVLLFVSIHVHSPQLEKNKYYVQQLEADLKKCREQIGQSEQDVAVVQREMGRIRLDSEEQRDALANEVNILVIFYPHGY